MGDACQRGELGGVGMQRSEKAKEPSMEEILASIRKIISEEPDGRAAPPPPRATLAAKPAPEAPPAERTARVTPQQSAAFPPRTEAPRAPARPLTGLGHDDDLSDILDQPAAERAPTPSPAPAPAPSPVSREPLFQAFRKANAEADTAPPVRDRQLPQVAAATPAAPITEPEGSSLADRLRGLGEARPGHSDTARHRTEPSLPMAGAPSLAASVFGRRPASATPPSQPTPPQSKSSAPPPVVLPDLVAEAPRKPAGAELPPAPAATPDEEPTARDAMIATEAVRDSAPSHRAPTAAAPERVERPPVATVQTEAEVAPPEASADPVPPAAIAARVTEAAPAEPETLAPAPADPSAPLAAETIPAYVEPLVATVAPPVASKAVPPAPASPTAVTPPPAPPLPVAAVTAAAVVPASTAIASPSEASAPLGAIRSLEDTVTELLRPMLREWLDANMPRIVEKALRVELAERRAMPKPTDTASKD